MNVIEEFVAAARALLTEQNPDLYPEHFLRLDAALDAYEDTEVTYHIVDVKNDTGSWVIQHPVSCRDNLFECPATVALSTGGSTPPINAGRYRLDLTDGVWVIGARV
jgi:hypothetical protein